MDRFELNLPWQDAALSPNARVHWGKKAQAIHAAKDYAFFAAREAGIEKFKVPGDAHLLLTVLANPPDARRHDEDNIKAMLKPAIDGVMFALGVDDSRIFESYLLKLSPVEYGQIRMILTMKESGKGWYCLHCRHELGIVHKNASGSQVLLVQHAGVTVEMDSGSVCCPVCGNWRKFVLCEERMEELLYGWRNYAKRMKEG